MNKNGVCPLISVIIPTYNRSAMLCNTIESFITQDYPKDRYEIIVSDNNSIDTTRKDVARYVGNPVSPVKYIFVEQQGVHYARNNAAKQASGEILYFTDDDMLADSALLTQLVKVFELFPEVGCATGLILPIFQKTPPNWVIRCLWNRYLSLTEKDKPEDLIISKNDLVYSCHQAIRRDIFLKSGGFNPENTAGIWIGDGETGLNLKIKKLGYSFAYTSKSIIYHIIPENRTNIKYLIRRIGNQGFCDSYSDYRQHRDRSKIIPLMLKRNTFELLKAIAVTLVKIAMRKNSWHFLPANINYFHKRNIYDLKLYRDECFRKIVEIDDWMNDEEIHSTCFARK